MLRAGLILLAAFACLAQVPAGDRAILEAARQNALAFSATLPNFICTQSIRRLQSPAGADSWRQTDLLLTNLSYSGGKEDYQLVSIDGRRTDESYQSVLGSRSNGEFGSWLGAIFDPATAAVIEPEGRQTRRDRTAAVFSYNVVRAHSHYELNYRAGSEIKTVTVAYHGRVFIDLATNRVARLEIEADEIPPEFPLRRSATLVEYDLNEISGRQYFLPRYAETQVATSKLEFLNEIEFRDYRKFDVEAAIRFADGSGDVTGDLIHNPNIESIKTGSTNARDLVAPVAEPARLYPDIRRLNDDVPIFPRPPEPTAEERRAVLEDASRAASGYLASLPPFVCADVFRILTAVPGDAWKTRGAVSGELRHSGDTFHVNLVEPDDSAASHYDEFQEALAAASSWNFEFWELSTNIFDPRSAAQFLWDHWTRLRGRPTHVYSFIVNTDGSQYQLTIGARGSVLAFSATVAQRGFVFVDRDLRRVTRIFAEAIAIPRSTGVSGASTQLDFDFADIEHAPALVPFQAELRVNSKSYATRFNSEFRGCANR